MVSYPRVHAAKAAAVLSERLPKAAVQRMLDEPQVVQSCDMPASIPTSALYRMVGQQQRAEGQLVRRVSKGRRVRGEKDGWCEVGCTIVKLDYRDSHQKARTSQQRSNNGRKIDRALTTDNNGSISQFERTVGVVELARQAEMAAAKRTRKGQR